MDTAELLQKVRKIEIKTRRLSADLFSGEYHSAFKGRGMAFSEVREYQPGDDIRAIDWNVTARFDQPFVKVFEEERELTVMLLLDLSPSAFFGTAGIRKNDLIAEISAVLAFTAVNNDDKVGAILFTDQVEMFLPPQKGRFHLLRLLREVLQFGEVIRTRTRREGRAPGTDIGEALRYFNGVIKKRSTAFLFSDFQSEDYETPLRIAARKHDLVGVHVHDRRERDLPDIGLARFFDSETGRYRWVDTADARVRAGWRAWYDSHRAYFRDAFRRSGSDVIAVDSSIPEGASPTEGIHHRPPPLLPQSRTSPMIRRTTIATLGIAATVSLAAQSVALRMDSVVYDIGDPIGVTIDVEHRSDEHDLVAAGDGSRRGTRVAGRPDRHDRRRPAPGADLHPFRFGRLPFPAARRSVS